jgi:hypothetical protein
MKEKRKRIKGQKCHVIVLASVCKFIMCVNLCLCGLWLCVYASGLNMWWEKQVRSIVKGG